MANPGRYTRISPLKAAMSARLFVVEDEYFVALMIEETMVSAGHEVLGVFASGEAAIAAAADLKPDLALLDIRLAGEMSGIEAAVALKELGIPCIFASANSDEMMRRSAERAAPLGWVTKPFAQAELVSVVSAALNQMAG
jgi:CheY-like chemotaxis protein